MFDEVELDVLFPGFTSGGLSRMRSAAKTVEAARLPKDTLRWDWWPENLRSESADEAMPLTVLGTTVTLFNNGSDWLELALCVVREQQPRLTVSATIEVACWCDPDHNMHVIRSEEHLVGTPTALAAAFESAANSIARWAGEGTDPDAYRTAAGLANAEPA